MPFFLPAFKDHKFLTQTVLHSLHVFSWNCWAQDVWSSGFVAESSDNCCLDKLYICLLMTLLSLSALCYKTGEPPTPVLVAVEGFVCPCFLNNELFLFNEFINTPRRKACLTYEKVNGFPENYWQLVLTSKRNLRSHAVLINWLKE